jgi:hypothetical protein
MAKQAMASVPMVSAARNWGGVVCRWIIVGLTLLR